MRAREDRPRGLRLPDYQLLVKTVFPPSALTIPRVQTCVSICARKETTNMSSKSGIVGTCVGIFALVAIVLGALEHESQMDPSFVDTAHVSVRGNAIVPPFRGE
jgi:hypothetical protein